jgi:predicted phosphoadenosine phosphosulfate sulfurtransferase
LRFRSFTLLPQFVLDSFEERLHVVLVDHVEVVLLGERPGLDSQLLLELLSLPERVALL